MDLNDKEWEIIEPLLPELPSGERGRPWQDMPKEYPSYQTCHRRFQQ